MLFDILAGVFWSATYLLAIVYAIKYKTHGIPVFCICSNFGWETIALIQSLFVWRRFSPAVIVHIAWFTLDSVIVALFLLHESKWHEGFIKKIAVISYYAFTLLVFALAFKFNGMLLSSFVIDLIMAVAFLFFAYRQEMIFSPLSLAIGVTKFIGDICAWICYRFDPIVDVIGIIVLICNFAYILLLSHKFYLKITKNKSVRRTKNEKHAN